MTNFPLITIEPIGIAVFDLSEAQDAIRRKYGRQYHLSAECLADVAALWGLPNGSPLINDAGVFLTCEIALDLHAGPCSAEIEVAASPSGLWSMGKSCWGSDSGGGSAPSVWEQIAFRSRDDARLAAVAKLIEYFEAAIARGAPRECDLRSMLALLKAERTPQLSLF